MSVQQEIQRLINPPAAGKARILLEIAAIKIAIYVICMVVGLYSGAERGVCSMFKVEKEFRC